LIATNYLNNFRKGYSLFSLVQSIKIYFCGGHMLNHIWLWMILISIVIAGGSDVYDAINKGKNTTVTQEAHNLNKDTKLGQITTAAIDSAALAVKIAFGLIGIMALWLGLMRIAEEAGMIKIIARGVRPITKRLFPTIPTDHPAIGAMIMNIAANMLGLSNAATPLGLKAMDELQKINPNKKEASNDMITFLVINTSAITIVPATAIAIRASLGSANPQMIVIPSILAALTATIVGLSVVKGIQFIQNKREKGIS
jgi:spore maturation protein A